MKKLLFLFIVLLAMIWLSACNQSISQQSTDNQFTNENGVNDEIEDEQNNQAENETKAQDHDVTQENHDSNENADQAVNDQADNTASAEKVNESKDNHQSNDSSADNKTKQKTKDVDYDMLLDKKIDNGKGHLYKIMTAGNQSQAQLKQMATTTRQKDTKSDFVKVIILKESNGHPKGFLAKVLFANTDKGAKMMGLKNKDDVKFYTED